MVKKENYTCTFFPYQTGTYNQTYSECGFLSLENQDELPSRLLCSRLLSSCARLVFGWGLAVSLGGSWCRSPPAFPP